MPLNTGSEPPDVVVVTLSGVVTPGDQAGLVAWVRRSIEKAGSVRVLVRLDRFSGWQPDISFDNPSLWLRDDEGVSQMAIVGAPEWKVGLLTLIAQPLRRMPIEYFESEAAARRWLGLATGATEKVPT